jgi:hypothetical protein
MQQSDEDLGLGFDNAGIPKKDQQLGMFPR